MPSERVKLQIDGAQFSVGVGGLPPFYFFAMPILALTAERFETPGTSATT